MLPAWATVALAIGGALIGAAAGVTASYFGYRGAKLNLAHEEREAWRRALIEATQAAADAWQDFASVYLYPLLETRVFDDAARKQGTGQDRDAGTGSLTTVVALRTGFAGR